MQKVEARRVDIGLQMLAAKYEGDGQGSSRQAELLGAQAELIGTEISKLESKIHESRESQIVHAGRLEKLRQASTEMTDLRKIAQTTRSSLQSLEIALESESPAIVRVIERAR